MPSFVQTPESPLSPDPNFPSGYNSQTNTQAFDFGREWQYQGISDATNGGIAVTNLTTMGVIATATLNQMYAGTSFGNPPGSPPSQVIYDVACGNNTEFYMLMDNGLGHGVGGEFTRFTRVNPATLKVDGEFYTSASFPPPINCIVGTLGVANVTTTHTIAAYFTDSGGLGPTVMDGTGMAPIGLAQTPTYTPNTNNTAIIAGPTHVDGSCDFLMLNADQSGATGNIDIWRVNVTDGLSLSNTLTGTANILGIFTPVSLYIAQSNYDAAHGTIILWLTDGTGSPEGPPIWLVSVNFDGSINWHLFVPGDIGIIESKGQSQLTGTTLLIGGGPNLKVINTGTGAIEFSGSVANVSGSFYRVYNAATRSYYTYALAVGAHTRVMFIELLARPFVMRPSR